MTQIKDYVLLLVGACLACGGLTILAPSGNFERIIRLIGSVFLLLCMLSPLGNIFHEVSDYSWADAVSDPLYQTTDSWTHAANAMEQTMISTVNDCVNTVTGRDAKDIDVEISTSEQTFTMTKVEITIHNSDSGKSIAVADYVAIKTGVRPTVISG